MHCSGALLLESRDGDFLDEFLRASAARVSGENPGRAEPEAADQGQAHQEAGESGNYSDDDGGGDMGFQDFGDPGPNEHHDNGGGWFEGSLTSLQAPIRVPARPHVTAAHMLNAMPVQQEQLGTKQHSMALCALKHPRDYPLVWGVLSL